jgi:two-component system, NarL family, nitrate/nitrite response regulator NarL
MIEPAKIRALLVDDHAVFRESVARALDGIPGLEITHCAGIGAALERLAHAPPDIVLLDHDLGRERASQFLPAAAQVEFSGRVLVVTAWISDNEARRLLRQGVAGIFLKQSPLDALVEAIRTVAAGGKWIDQRFAAAAGQEIAAAARPVRFSERQREVLRFVLEGLANKEIAWRLGISESYVKAILQGLFHKTGVRTRGQLVRVALEQYGDQL